MKFMMNVPWYLRPYNGGTPGSPGSDGSPVPSVPGSTSPQVHSSTIPYTPWFVIFRALSILLSLFLFLAQLLTNLSGWSCFVMIDYIVVVQNMGLCMSVLLSVSCLYVSPSTNLWWWSCFVGLDHIAAINGRHQVVVQTVGPLYVCSSLCLCLYVPPSANLWW